MSSFQLISDCIASFVSPVIQVPFLATGTVGALGVRETGPDRPVLLALDKESPE